MVEFQQVVQRLRTTLHAQVAADRAEALGGDHVAVGQPDRSPRAQGAQLADPVPVTREAPVVGLGLVDHDLPGGGVDVVDRTPHGAQPSGDDGAGERVGARGEVVQGGEAPEGLAEHRPRPGTEELAEELAVVDDLVGPQVGQVLRLRGGVQTSEGRRSPARRRASTCRCRAGRAAPPGSPPAPVPARADLVGVGRPASWPGPALQEDQVGPRLAAFGCDHPGEHLDGAGGGVGGVEGGVEGDAGEGQSLQVFGGRWHSPQVSGRGSVRAGG